MQIIKGVQTSEEWFALRATRMTASEAQAVGNNGAGLESYIFKKMAEYYSQGEWTHISNDDMERGKEREPQAKFLYCNETGNEIEEVCFVILNDYVGCSPDGLIGTDGLVEYKCPSNLNYFKLLTEYKNTGDFTIKSEYIWQMNMQMDICKRKWCDFVCYNPNYSPKLLIKRVYPCAEKIENLHKGYKIGENHIKKIMGYMGES